MEKPKIAFNAIMRDNEDTIIRLLDSTHQIFDEYIFCDTGSIDKTKDLARKWCKKHNKRYKIVDYSGYKSSTKDKRERKAWGDISQVYWDFGDARQIALENTSDDMDFFFWADTDDIIENIDELYNVLEDMLLKGAYLGNLPYHYAQDEHGNDVVLHYRERVIRLKDQEGRKVKVRWDDPVHEYVWLPKDKRTKVMVSDAIHLFHKREIHHVKRTNRRNNRIMYRQLEEYSKKKTDKSKLVRLLSVLAYDHYERHEFEEAIDIYEQLFNEVEGKEYPYISLYTCYRNYARSCITFGNMSDPFDRNLQKARGALEKMTLLDRDNPDAYLEMAELSLQQGNIDLCERYLDVITNKKPKKSMLPSNDLDYKVRPLMMRSQIESMKGNLAGAAQLAEMALRHVPGNPNIEKQRRQLLYNIPSQKAFEGVLALREELYNTGEFDKLIHLIGVVPKTILGKEPIQKVIQSAKTEYKEYEGRHSIRVKGKKNISFYVGPAYENWTPESTKKGGIGGSESMVIELAKGLHDLGNEVKVYNQCGLDSGNYEGVEYIDYRKHDPREECDILIVERQPQYFRNLPNAKRQYLHLHDMPSSDMPLKFFNMPDRIFVMSNFHQKAYQEAYGLDDDRFWVTRNSIDVDLEEAKKKAGKRKPYKMLYASSYDRGLEFTIKAFNEIKKQVPEAELHVFYGWMTYEKRMQMLLKQGHPEGKFLKEYKDRVEKLLKSDGIIHHGRVDKVELAKHQYESSLWTYFTNFAEISCITGMVAQATGAIPITADHAALSETVQHGWKLQAPIGYSNEFLPIYTEQTVKALKDQKGLEKIREKMMPWAVKTFSSKELAREWNTYFEEN